LGRVELIVILPPTHIPLASKVRPSTYSTEIPILSAVESILGKSTGDVIVGRIPMDRRELVWYNRIALIRLEFIDGKVTSKLNQVSNPYLHSKPENNCDYYAYDIL
jgi:hypothetical protein